MFWKKKEEKEVERFYIPKEDIEEFYVLLDESNKLGGRNKTANYMLWSFICELFPEMDKNETFFIRTYNIMRPYISRVE